MVENIRPGDAAQFTLKVLRGQRLARMLERAKEQRYYTVRPGLGHRGGAGTTWVAGGVAGCMTELTTAQVEYLASQRLGRIATAGADHRPHVVPTSFRYNAELGTIDAGGQHVATTKKYRDVQANGWAAIVVDDLVSVDPWQPRMLEIRGRAEAIPHGGEYLGPGFGAAFIRIHPDKVNSYGIS